MKGNKFFYILNTSKAPHEGNQTGVSSGSPHLGLALSLDEEVGTWRRNTDVPCCIEPAACYQRPEVAVGKRVAIDLRARVVFVKVVVGLHVLVDVEVHTFLEGKYDVFYDQ